MSPSITRRLIEDLAARPDPIEPPSAVLAELTPREREVLVLVAHGLSNTEIASRLIVTEATVKSHVGSILLKLGLRDRVQAVVFAYEHGIARRSVTPWGSEAKPATHGRTPTQLLAVLEGPEQMQCRIVHLLLRHTR